VTLPDLPTLWRETQRALPAGFELVGMSFQGPDMDDATWIALGEHSSSGGDAEYCEGAGNTPEAAAAALIDHAISDHAPKSPERQ
jgi:hypothetical protein